MHLVTGISGQLGHAALRELIRHGPQKVAGATRTPERHGDLAAAGVTIRFADFDRADSLPAAFAGVTDLLLVSTGTHMGEHRVRQHVRAIDAARAAGAGRLVYTSLLNAHLPLLGRVATDHLETEHQLSASGLAQVSLRNAFYMEMLLDQLPAAMAGGKWVSAAGDGAIAYITRADCAQAAAAAMMAAPQVSGPLDIAGEPIYAAELLAIVEDVLGVSIALSSLDQAGRAEQLAAEGVPAQMARMLAHIEDAIRQGAMHGTRQDFTRLTGRPPIALRTFLETHAEGLLEKARTLRLR